MPKRLCWTHGSLPSCTATTEADCYVCALERMVVRYRCFVNSGTAMVEAHREADALLGKRALAKWRRRIEKEMAQGGNRDGA